MTVNLSTDQENQLIELSCDNKFKQLFDETSLEVFGYINYTQEFMHN